MVKILTFVTEGLFGGRDFSSKAESEISDYIDNGWSVLAASTTAEASQGTTGKIHLTVILGK